MYFLAEIVMAVIEKSNQGSWTFAHVFLCAHVCSREISTLFNLYKVQTIR